MLVVDFGAQYAQLIARRVRECHVYSEIVPSTASTAELLERNPSAIILSGGPASVYAPGAPPGPAGLLGAGVPVLGICYGFQLMVRDLGGEVARTGSGEYGATALRVAPAPDARTHRGGVLLETDAGTIDAKVSTQLREVRRLLAVDDAMTVSPSSEAALINRPAQAS